MLDAISRVSAHEVGHSLGKVRGQASEKAHVYKPLPRISRNFGNAKSATHTTSAQIMSIVNRNQSAFIPSSNATVALAVSCQENFDARDRALSVMSTLAAGSKERICFIDDAKESTSPVTA